MFVSDFVLDEAGAGDATAAAERLKMLAGIPLLPGNDQILELSKRLAAVLTSLISFETESRSAADNCPSNFFFPCCGS